MACVSCAVIGVVEQAALSEAGRIYGLLAGPAQNLLNASAGVYFLWRFVRQALEGWDWWGLITESATLSFGVFLLASPTTYLEWVHAPFTSLVFGVAGLSIGSGSGAEETSLTGLALAVEDNFAMVVTVAFALWKDASITNPLGWLAAILLLVPFFLQLGIFTLQVTWAIGLTIVPYALGPLFIVAGMFPLTRRILMSSLDFYLSALMVISCSALFLTLGSSAARLFFDKMPKAANGEAVDLTGYIQSAEFVGALLVGYLSIWMLLKAEVVAAYITNRIDLQRNFKLPKVSDLFKPKQK